MGRILRWGSLQLCQSLVNELQTLFYQGLVMVYATKIRVRDSGGDGDVTESLRKRK